MGTLNLPTPRWAVPFVEPRRYKALHGGRGGGKCLGVGTLVMMADGGVKLVEDVRKGDCVMGPDGRPRNVLGTATGTGPLYRVRQAAAGEYVVNDAHLLSLRRGAHGAGRYPGADVLHVTPDEYLAWSEKRKSSFFGYKAGPIELPREELPVPPYVFGAWIGDGCSDRQSITSMDEEIISAFVAWGESLGCREVRRKKPGQQAFTVILTKSQGCLNPAKQILRGLGVLGSKHVPEMYHRSTLADRLEFLAGIVDTDGYMHNGCFEISQKNVGIAQSVKRIADTCGFKTSFRVKQVRVGDEYRPYALVSIGGDTGRIPVRLGRKKTSVHKNKDWLIGKLSVEPVGEGDYAGFELDGDHLFCLGDGTVTHNSHFFAECTVERCVMYPGTRIVCVREVQKSLKESVKRLVEDKIESLGAGALFKVQSDRIVTPGGGVIMFQGMQDHTAESIKSLEGFDVGYVEEAQTLTARSLELLRPTIRKDAEGGKPASELWFSWNPRAASDPVDKFFRENGAPNDAIVARVLYRDNPFFPAVLEQERQHDRVNRPDRYAHIWLGEYEPRAIGAIWDHAAIARNRRDAAPPLQRVVVAIDPAVSSHEDSDETGIIVAGVGEDGRGYVLGDYSMRGAPRDWAERAIAAYDLHEADAILAEVNQGGEMVRNTVHSVRSGVRVIEVRASRGKHLRAEPISSLYAMDRVSHIGAFPELEAEMCLMTASGYDGHGSPDRVDAMVYAFSELFKRLTRRGRENRTPGPTRANSRASAHGSLIRG